MENEKFLIESILRYVVPQKQGKPVKSGGKLEEILKKANLPIKKEFSFIDDILGILGAPNNNEIKKFEAMTMPDFQNEAKKDLDEGEISYAAMFQRTKEPSQNGYRVEITYEHTEIKHVMKVKIEFESYNAHKNAINSKDKEKKQYSFEISNEKENNPNGSESLKLVYESTYDQERLSINYRSTIGTYLRKREDALQNFEDRVPGKHVSSFSRNEMPGVLGFTYLGQDRMALRDDLIGRTRKMVDIHESIHTPDEYETRILTDWIMSKPNRKYIR